MEANPASKNSELAPAAVSPSERIDAIDVVRGFALLGVLTVNLLTSFRISLFDQFLPHANPPGGLNGFIEKFVLIALDSKAFSLFSILFGIGLAIQFERLSHGSRPYYFLFRRLIALLAFGLLHFLFIWNGDILTEYALAALLILPVLGLPGWALAALGAGLFEFYILLPVLPSVMSWPDAAMFSTHVAAANSVYSTGTYPEIWRFSVSEFTFLLPLHVFVFPRTLALFLFGVGIWRSGVLRDPAQHRHLFLSVALAGILVGLALTYAPLFQPFSRWRAADLLAQVVPVVLACGYGAFVIWIVQFRGIKKALAPISAVGRMAFTNYILQSVIFGLIFFNYGLGLFGKMAAAPALLLGLVVYILQIVFSTFWLRDFRFGPLEWLWRTLMYGKPQPIRLAHHRAGTTD